MNFDHTGYHAPIAHRDGDFVCSPIGNRSDESLGVGLIDIFDTCVGFVFGASPWLVVAALGLIYHYWM